MKTWIIIMTRPKKIILMRFMKYHENMMKIMMRLQMRNMMKELK